MSWSFDAEDHDQGSRKHPTNAELIAGARQVKPHSKENCGDAIWKLTVALEAAEAELTRRDTVIEALAPRPPGSIPYAGVGAEFVVNLCTICADALLPQYIKDDVVRITPEQRARIQSRLFASMSDVEPADSTKEADRG